MKQLEILNLAEQAIWMKQDKEEEKLSSHDCNVRVHARKKLQELRHKEDEISKLILAEEQKVLNS